MLSNAGKTGHFEGVITAMEMFDELPPELRSTLNYADRKYGIKFVYDYIEQYLEQGMSDDNIIKFVSEKIRKSDEYFRIEERNLWEKDQMDLKESKRIFIER